MTWIRPMYDGMVSVGQVLNHADTTGLPGCISFVDFKVAFKRRMLLDLIE